MSRIEDAAIQDEIASSLLSPAEQEAERAAPEPLNADYQTPGKFLLDAAIEEQNATPLKLGDRGLAEYREKYGVPQLDRQAERQQPGERPGREQEQVVEAVPTEPVDLTPAQLTAVTQELDAKLKEYGAADPGETLRFETDLAGMFGIAPSPEHVGAMDRTIGRVSLAAGQFVGEGKYDGDINAIPPVPVSVARNIAGQVGQWFGINTQTQGVHDEQLLGNVIYRGMVNLVHSLAANPGRAPADINHADMCVGWCMALQKGLFGTEHPVDRGRACAIVNRLTERVLGIDSRLQEYQAAHPQRQPRASTPRQRIPSSLPGIRGSNKAPRMVSNLDLFGPDTMATYKERLPDRL